MIGAVRNPLNRTSYARKPIPDAQQVNRDGRKASQQYDAGDSSQCDESLLASVGAMARAMAGMAVGRC